MKKPRLINRVPKQPHQYAIFPDSPEVLPRISSLPVPSRSPIRPCHLFQIVPDGVIPVANGEGVIAALARDDRDRLWLGEKLQREAGQGRGARGADLAPATLDECRGALGDPPGPPVEQAVAGALRREQDLSLIIDELRQCLLRRTGAGEAAVEEVALRASLGGEGVDAQHDAGDRVA